jgi:hypothetical protein
MIEPYTVKVDYLSFSVTIEYPTEGEYPLDTQIARLKALHPENEYAVDVTNYYTAVTFDCDEVAHLTPEFVDKCKQQVIDAFNQGLEDAKIGGSAKHVVPPDDTHMQPTDIRSVTLGNRRYGPDVVERMNEHASDMLAALYHIAFLPIGAPDATASEVLRGAERIARIVTTRILGEAGPEE